MRRHRRTGRGEKEREGSEVISVNGPTSITRIASKRFPERVKRVARWNTLCKTKGPTGALMEMKAPHKGIKTHKDWDNLQ